MEPARGERDDKPQNPKIARRSESPQWSPLVVSGMTRAARIAELTCDRPPQWSPLVVSGMTPRPRRIARTRTRAAMEPARGERDDRASAHCSPARSDSPQWSPLVVSGMTFARRKRLKEEIWPQWSPLVVSGMTSWISSALRRFMAGRNGARSW